MIFIKIIFFLYNYNFAKLTNFDMMDNNTQKHYQKLISSKQIEGKANTLCNRSTIDAVAILSYYKFI